MTSAPRQGACFRPTSGIDFDCSLYLALTLAAQNIALAHPCIDNIPSRKPGSECTISGDRRFAEPPDLYSENSKNGGRRCLDNKFAGRLKKGGQDENFSVAWEFAESLDFELSSWAQILDLVGKMKGI